MSVGKILAATPLVRRNVTGLAASDPIILSYGKAIKAMKALPTSNPLSWAYQAAIHGNTVLPPLPGWNSCQHGSYFFWSWHRIYLYWFERIIRKISNNPNWTLPYWNWTAASGRKLPAVFRDTTSELYTSNRNPAMNNGSGSLPASDVSYSSAFSRGNFASASSALEGTPHGAVHVDVGGFMGSVPTAAQDPIFYLHHCNIDRLWNLWLAQGGRSDPLNDNTWKSQHFTFFDENGASVTMTSCEVLRSAEQLNISYQGEPTEVKLYCQNAGPSAKASRAVEKVTLTQVPLPEVVLTSELVSFPINLSPVREHLKAATEKKEETLLLEFDQVEAERQPGAVWEVYLGLPEKTKPDPNGPYYIGNIALFGAGVKSEGHHEYKAAHFEFPISRAMKASLAAKGDQLQVSIVPHGVLINGKPTKPQVDATVRIGQASLTVERPAPQ